VKQIVVDASLALSWCFPDEKTPYSESVLTLLETDTEAVVPSLWLLEIVNALIVAERRKRITHEQAQEFLNNLDSLGVTVEPTDSSLVFNDVYELARQHTLTAYDAAYLELAIRKGLPLASLDEPLKKAALASGVKLIEP
jgi:predicted nucleic acid-binding protein